MIKILVLIFSVASFAANEPMFIKNQNSGNKEKIRDFQAPNYQATKVGVEKFLIETGSNNILENPSFEHGTFDEAWSIGSGVASKIDVDTDDTKVFKGLNALKMTMAATSLSVFNVSPISNQAYKDGVQGLVSIRVKTTVSGIRVCQRKGFAVTTNCVNVNPDGKWGLYKVPSILGEFYNGVEVTSLPTAVTGDVFIDDAFVGVTDIAQISSAIGPWTSYTPTWTVVSGTNPSIGNGSISGKWRQVGESVEVVFSINSGTTTTYGSGVYVVSLPSGLTIDSTKALDDYGTANIYNNASGFQTYIGKVISNTSTSMRFIGTGVSLWSNVAPVTLAAATAGHTFTANFSVPVTQFSGSVSTYSTPMLTNADRIGEVIQTTNSTAPQGFISALNKSIGQTGSGATYTGQTYFTLYEHLWSIAGLTTTAGDVYRISSAKGASALADFAANKTITVDYETNAPFIRGKASAAGVGAYTADQFQGHRHQIEQASSTVNGGDGYIGTSSTGAAGIRSGIGASTSDGTNGTPRIGNETRPKNVSLNIFIRYAGDTQLITGQFNGLQTCTDTLACTDTFSAYISAAGIVSNENVDWLTGNCSLSATSQFDCTVKTGLTTVGMNCSATTSPSSAYGQNVHIAQSVPTSLITVTANNGTTTRYGHYVVCQKQGADYIGKTAMAVASDQNVRSIGSTNVDIQSISFSSGLICSTGTCITNLKVGNKITSVSWAATGAYNVNGVDGAKYNCSGTAYNSIGSVVASGFPDIAASTSSYARVAFGGGAVANIGWGTITCIGIP